MARVSTSSEMAGTQSLLELSSRQDAGQWSNPESAMESAALGIPCKRTAFSRSQLLALIVSLVCLALGIITVLPNTGIDWRLQFNGQIVVVGMLLSISNICLRVILPVVFLMVEARFGHSRLQNFEAIVSGSFISSHISVYWRFILLVLTLLPLGLSIAYKRFLGGSATALLTLDYEGQYGIDFPRIGAWSNIQDPVYLLVSSMAAFDSATEKGTADYPNPDTFPLAYGYNTLLLSNYSAAILDIPSSSYISAMQGNLSSGESLDISATVDAYVTTYNAATTADFRTNDDDWDTAWESNRNNDEWGLTSLALYHADSAAIGLMPVGDINQTVFALYYNSTNPGAVTSYLDPDDEEIAVFRSQSQTYDIERMQCRGCWHLNASTILLVGGNCDGNIAANSSVMYRSHMGLYSADIIPPLAHTFGFLAPGLHLENPWLQATYAVSVATMLWARDLYMIAGGTEGVTYSPVGETIVSTRTTLRADGLLYLVLAIQPLLTIAGFALIIWLHNIPISYDFSIISILSGLDPTSLGFLRGAGLSGQLSVPVSLDITTGHLSFGGQDAHHGKPGDGPYQIQYRVRKESKSKKEKSFLKKDWMYW